MKHFAAPLASAAIFAGHVAAFPHLAMDHLSAPIAADVAYKQLLERQSATPPQGAGALPLVPPPFDAKSQLIDVSGAHAVRSLNPPVRGLLTDFRSL